jgi:transcriptional regulator with GAF, ATPase, and Fis domain
VQELEALFGSEVVGIALFDTHMVCERANDRFAQLARNLAISPVGMNIRDMGRRYPAEIEVMRGVLDTGQPALGRHVEGPTTQAVVDFLPVRAGDAVTHCLLVVHDITGQRQAERELARRLKMAELISELSATFIDLPSSEVNTGIENALRSIGETLGLDRTHVGLFTPDQTRVTLTHQWVRPGGQATIEDFQDFQVKFLPWLARHILSGRTAILSSLDDLPPGAEAERLLFQSLGNKSMLMVPLIVGRSIIGIVEFVCTREAIVWQSDLVAVLQLAGEIFASAIDRKRTDDALRERLRAAESVLQFSTRFIDLPASAIGEGIMGALKSIGEALDLDRTQVGLLQEDNRDMVRIHYQWLREGLPPDPLNLDFTGMPASSMPWMNARLQMGQSIVFDDCIQLPIEATVERKIFEARGTRSAVILPLTAGGVTIGLVGFTQIRRKREWTAEDLVTLNLVAQIIANSLARKHADDERRRAFEELEALKARIENERDYLREEIRIDHGAADIIGGSPALRSALAAVQAVARTNATVLVCGESGVGKELFAREIHARSGRADGPLVKVNCAAVPKELFESEFFGHVRGAFTGAHKDRTGRFELAHGGTLFLDEVGEIPLDLQSKLLRVLQEGELERVGDDRTRSVNVRVVAATNRNLETEVAAGRFRQDLYYRLSVFPIEVPPLRLRREDIVPLAQHFLQLFCRDSGRARLTLSEEHKRSLCDYHWPGNVRELQHVIERAVILSSVPPLRLDLALPASQVSPAPQASPLIAPAAPPPLAARPAATVMTESDLRALERDNLMAALEKARWRVSGEGGAAQLLGVRPSTLRDRMKALGIQRPQ